MIYILNVKRKNPSARNAYVLRCIEFPDRKPVATFKRSLEMDLQMVGMRAKDNMQIVRFSGENAYCLCQQHANPVGNVIQVSVWIFHHDIKFDIDIPFVPSPSFGQNSSYSMSAPPSPSSNSSPPAFEYSPDYLAKVKVFFDTIGDLLVIYVPGVYLQLIDCAVDHEPTVNLVLSGPTFNSPLLDMDPSIPALVETFEMRGGESKNGKRLSLLDRARGLLYEYKLNQNTIVTATSMPDPGLHKQLLALALLHVQDEDTPESIMLNLLRKHPGLVTADLMKYFLLGAPYREYRKKNDVIHKKVASLLPIIPAAIPPNSNAANSSSGSKYGSSTATSLPQATPSASMGSGSGGISPASGHSPRTSFSSSYSSSAHQSPGSQHQYAHHSHQQAKSMAIPSATRRGSSIGTSGPASLQHPSSMHANSMHFSSSVHTGSHMHHTSSGGGGGTQHAGGSTLGAIPSSFSSTDSLASSLSSSNPSFMMNIAGTPSSGATYLPATGQMGFSEVSGSVSGQTPSPISIGRPGSPSLNLPTASSSLSNSMMGSSGGYPPSHGGFQHSPASGGSLSDSPNSMSSGSFVSLGTSWHQPEISDSWMGYQLVQKQWPDRSSAIQLPASIFLTPNKSTVIHARLWAAGKDANESSWTIEHLGGSMNPNLRQRETGTLATLSRLFSDDSSASTLIPSPSSSPHPLSSSVSSSSISLSGELEAKDWFYAFQSNEGIWYRARLATCVDPVIGPGFASSIPVVSIAPSHNLSTSSTSSGNASARKTAPVRINLSALDWQNVHEDYIPQQTVFKKLIGAMGRIFGQSDEAGGVPKDRQDSEEYSDPKRLWVTGAYCKHLFENLSGTVKATRAECFEWASHYRNLQANAVGRLYRFIHVCAGEMPQHLLFQVYSTFHEVLEELMLPTPIDFYTKYTVAGYFCLPRHLFVQYAEHGIFQLSRQFVEQLEVRNPEDARFKYLMLSYLSKDDALAVLRSGNEGAAAFVAEDIVSRHEPDAHVEIELEDVPPNEFLPLGAYHQSLEKSKKKMGDLDLKFVSETTSKLFKKPAPTIPTMPSSGRLFFPSSSHNSIPARR